MKLGSLFDGSGTAPLAATMCGIEPVWASEIEPYPIKVTTARFPNMKHLGSILDIDGAKAEPVDIICGGSPCQDLSVAGKQKGLHEGERSHLFFEMTRIIKEMRDATNGKYPRYIIWENVPGAFSSNNGRDFLAVLQAFAEIADPDIYVPEPPRKGKTDRLAWRYAGSIVGDGWSIAWRTVDAQYWGVPQRRRRIYLVADLGSERAGEILFEREGMRGDSAESGEAWEEAAEDAGRSTEGSSGTWSLSAKQQSLAANCEVGATIAANDYKEPQVAVYPLNEQVILRHKRLGDGTGFGAGDIGDPAYTLQANHPHAIVAGFVGRQGAKSGSVGFEEGVSPTLRQGITTDCVYAIEGNTIDCNSNKNGSGVCVDVSPTMNTRDKHGVAFAADCRNGVLNEELSATLQSKNSGGYSLNYQNPVLYEAHGFSKYRDGCGTLRASGGDCGPGSEMLAVYPDVGITSKQNQSNPKPGDPCCTLSNDSRNYLVKDCYPEITGSLCANSHPGSYTGQNAFNNMLPVVRSGEPHRKYIVRRLTPLECCRLQGFPDWWEDGVEGSDSARYKMWGNGMALPNMLHVMKGIAMAEQWAGDAREAIL